MSQKKGMEFFKKFSGSGEGKPSILSGMKIKTSKESKPVAQTETNLNFTSKKQEEAKPEPVSRDDIDIKKQQAPSAYKPITEPQGVGVDFKKASSKSSENKQRVQNAQIHPQIKEEDTIEQDQGVEPVLDSHKNLVETKPYDHQESRSSKSYKHTTEASSIQVTKNDYSPRSAKPELKEKKVQVPEKKKAQKPLSTKKPEESVSIGRRPSTTREPQKPKKSDREQVLDEINEFTLKLAKTIIYQREIKIQIAQTKASISDLRDQVARWTSQQTVCAQKEEYQEADRLQQSIQQGEKKIEELQMQLGYMEQQVVKQQHEEVQLLKSQNSNMKRLSRKLKLVELQLQDEAADIKRAEMEKIQTLKTKQDSERKKMTRIEKDITYQSEQISQFEKQFTKEIDQKMNPLKEQRDDLEANRGNLEAEIKELERKLKEKKASLAEVVKELKTVNQNITSIEESFKQESEKLQERKNKLQLVENERDQIHLTITDIDTTIQQATQSMEAKFNQKMNEANELSELAKNIEQKQITFEDEIEARRAALDSFLLNANSLKDFENKHRAEKQKIKEIEYKKSTISGEICKLQQRREQLKKKIPALEVEQKKFADQKNFKAAGIKKGEIKEINEELGMIKERLDGYLGQEHGLQIEYDEICEAQKEANIEEAILQKNLAYSQVKFDSEKLRKLEEYQTDIQKANGLPAKDKQKLLRELSSEINRLKEEIKYLTTHYELNNSPRKQQVQQELENNNEPELEKRDNEVEELVDAQTKQVELSKEEEQQSEEEERKYEPLVLDGQVEPQELQDNEDGGYVPLQLDD